VTADGNGAAKLAAHVRALAGERPLGDGVDLERVGGYRGYADVMRALADAGTHGGMSVERIGGTAGGQPIFVLQVGPARRERLSVVMAGVHAMEWIGVEVGLGLLSRLVAAPPLDRRVLFFPLVNVDGYRHAEADLRAGRRRFARANGRGVDLNRNWPTHWRPRPFGGRGPLAFLGTAGPHPRSEPEVDAVCRRLDRELLAGCVIDRAVSLHSFGRMILFPWGGQWRRPMQVERLRSRGRAVARRITERYRVTQSSRWVPGSMAFGMELDFLHAHCQADSLLVECSGGGLRIGAPASWLHPFRWFNPPDPERVVDQLAPALEPFVRGQE